MATMKKAFLILLVIVCAGVAAWNAYLLFTDQTDPPTGWVIFAVSVGVLLWNISVLRAYRVRARTAVVVALVVLLLAGTVGAFAGVEPLAEIKNTLTAKVEALVRGVADPETKAEPEALEIVRAVITAYNEGRADRLANLTTSGAYSTLTSFWSDHWQIGLAKIVDYNLTIIHSDVPNRVHFVRVQGGIKDIGWPVVYPYDATYVVRVEGGNWLVTEINLRSP